MAKRALISVSNKDGVVEFARGLEELGYEIVSTGGTYDTLVQAGIKVVKVAEVTGFPEILDGRVKTLHPAVHGGILAKRSPDHLEQLQMHGIQTIDIVAVNLYPFRETVLRPGVTLEEAIENIDIGGPTMVRAAAKNWEGVAIVVDGGDYIALAGEMQANAGALTRKTRFALAKKAFTHTAAYDAAIGNYLTCRELEGEPRAYPDVLTLQWSKAQDMRYGENPHQRAAFYVDGSRRPGVASGVVTALVFDGDADVIEILLDNPKGMLKSGMFAEVHLPTMVRHQVVAVPQEAVVAKGARRVVYVVDSKSVAHERPVTVGVENENLAEITEGLKAGEPVVVKGSTLIRDGDKVKVVAGGVDK